MVDTQPRAWNSEARLHSQLAAHAPTGSAPGPGAYEAGGAAPTPPGGSRQPAAPAHGSHGAGGAAPPSSEARLARMVAALDEHERSDPSSRQAQLDASYFASLRVMLREALRATSPAHAQRLEQLEAWFESTRPRALTAGGDAQHGGSPPSSTDGSELRAHAAPGADGVRRRQPPADLAASGRGLQGAAASPFVHYALSDEREVSAMELQLHGLWATRRKAEADEAAADAQVGQAVQRWAAARARTAEGSSRAQRAALAAAHNLSMFQASSRQGAWPSAREQDSSSDESEAEPPADGEPRRAEGAHPRLLLAEQCAARGASAAGAGSAPRWSGAAQVAAELSASSLYRVAAAARTAFPIELPPPPPKKKPPAADKGKPPAKAAKPGASAAKPAGPPAVAAPPRNARPMSAPSAMRLMQLQVRPRRRCARRLRKECPQRAAHSRAVALRCCCLVRRSASASRPRLRAGRSAYTCPCLSGARAGRAGREAGAAERGVARSPPDAPDARPLRPCAAQGSADAGGPA